MVRGLEKLKEKSNEITFNVMWKVQDGFSSSNWTKMLNEENGKKERKQKKNSVNV